jgi:hypothetical protein
MFVLVYMCADSVNRVVGPFLLRTLAELYDDSNPRMYEVVSSGGTKRVRWKAGIHEVKPI